MTTVSPKRGAQPLPAWRRLAARARRFRTETRGSLSLETVIVFPLLAWAYASTFTYFDAFRMQAVNTKSAYTISDMLSRVTDEMNQDYIDGLHEIFDFMVRRTDETTSLLVTVIGWDVDANDYVVVWSRGSGTEFEHTDTSLDEIEDQIPEIAAGDTLILVETYMTYDTAFNVGLEDLAFVNIVPSSPRFAPQLKWEGLEDGGGTAHDDGTPGSGDV